MSNCSPILQSDSVRNTIPSNDTTFTIRCTGITAETPLTKRMFVDEDGALTKKAAVNPIRGTFTHIEHTGTADEVLNAYANVLHSLSPRQAIIAARLPSPLAADGSKWRLTTKNENKPGALPRSQATFYPVEGPALLSLDFDIPASLRPVFATVGDLYRKVLLPAWPGFAEVAMLGRASVSSGAKLMGTPDPLPTGYHLACIVSDGARVEEFALTLFDHIALLGFALIEASRSGAALKRALVDVAAAKGSERLIFEADPVIGEGVERVRRPFARHPGGVLDANVALAEMALEARDRFKLWSIWNKALTNGQPALQAARQRWLDERGIEIAQNRMVTLKEGRRLAEQEHAQLEAGGLHDAFPIRLDGGEVVTVTEIVANPERYAGKRHWSIDDMKPRRGVGFIQPYSSKPDLATGKPAGPWLHSFEHGGRYWRLRSENVALTNYRKFKADQKRNNGHG